MKFKMLSVYRVSSGQAPLTRVYIHIPCYLWRFQLMSATQYIRPKFMCAACSSLNVYLSVVSTASNSCIAIYVDCQLKY